MYALNESINLLLSCACEMKTKVTLIHDNWTFFFLGHPDTRSTFNSSCYSWNLDMEGWAKILLVVSLMAPLCECK